MKFREAEIKDIPQIQKVRHSVKENVLSDPSLVTDEDCKEYLTIRGKGWVCEEDDQVIGFAIADLKDNNIWALFIQPEFEGQGIGSTLHDIMLRWYFEQGNQLVWLSTTPCTKAERFYKNRGWKDVGLYGLSEVRLELEATNWKAEAHQKQSIRINF